jgi:aminoglycoside 2'-N-acetyltransferase I
MNQTGPVGDRRLRRLATPELTEAEIRSIRAIMDEAFGADEDERFTDHDWEHALGGVHFVIDLDGEIVGHASVVERQLELDDRPVRTGYVEAVAVAPGRQGRGLGSALMTDVNAWITGHFELGALGTGRHRFYERLGWLTWRGPSFVRTSAGKQRTPEDDGFILVLSTPASPPIDLRAQISCEWRPGDAW